MARQFPLFSSWGILEIFVRTIYIKGRKMIGYTFDICRLVGPVNNLVLRRDAIEALEDVLSTGLAVVFTIREDATGCERLGYVNVF